MQADQKQQQAALQQGVQVVGYAPNGVPLVAAPMANPWAQMPVQYAYPYPPAPVYADPLTHAGQLAQHHVPLVSSTNYYNFFLSLIVYFRTRSTQGSGEFGHLWKLR